MHRHNGELYNLKWPIEINDCGRKEWVSIVSNGYNMDGEITIRYDIVERETVDYEYIEETVNQKSKEFLGKLIFLIFLKTQKNLAH